MSNLKQLIQYNYSYIKYSRGLYSVLTYQLLLLVIDQNWI